MKKKKEIDVVAEVTNDWVETFSDPKNQNGFMWRMAADMMLSECVDPTDPRVIALCNKARRDACGDAR